MPESHDPVVLLTALGNSNQKDILAKCNETTDCYTVTVTKTSDELQIYLAVQRAALYIMSFDDNLSELQQELTCLQRCGTWIWAENRVT